MKLIHVLIVVAVLVLGWLAWKNLPGLRTSVTDKVEQYGGWTEEARRADPVGFLTYAEEKLAADIEAFRESRKTLADAKANAETQKAKSEKLLSAASGLALEFRVAFQAAEASGAWPVALGGASYDREQLVSQVESILTESETYANVVETYGKVMETAQEQRDALRGRIQAAEATLVELKAQKELVRVDQLTAEADELLAQIDVLLSGNQKVLVDLDEPVRSVESLLAASREDATTAPTKATTLEFLTKE